MSFNSATPWTCPYCTVINYKSLTRCDTCDQPRPGHRKRQSESQSNWWPWSRKKPRQWSCDKCTHSNNQNDKNCASCGKEKRSFFGRLSDWFSSKNTNSSTSSSSVDVTKGSEWVCSQCTYHNDPSAIECRQCSNHRSWDECMGDDVVGSQDDTSHDHDVIMLSHNGIHDDTLEDVMIIDDAIITSDDAIITSDDAIITSDDVMIINDDKNKQKTWQCNNCTAFNKNNSKCSVCGITDKKTMIDVKDNNFDPSTQWACAHCSMHNTNNRSHCAACGIPGKKKAPTTSFDPLTQWKCQDCSLHNINSDTKCRACDGRRDRAVVKKQDVPTNQWQCIHCSLYNSNDNDTCKACDIHKPKVSMATKELLSTSSSFESSMRRTRLYTNHIAYISISVRDKRSLIDHEAMSRYQSILEFCKKDKSTFVDPDFAPGPKSLYRDSSRHSHFWMVTQWCRPGEIRSNEMYSSAKWTVYRNPEPGDIAQGALGTCWFLSALSVLAEKPELVEQIIVNKQYTEYGIYLLRLCKDGCWSVIQVDDYLPCTKDGVLVFSKGLRKQLWVPLIEKALAKLYGSYEAIESGFVLSGLSILTGYPCENIRLQSDDKKSSDNIDDNLLWAKLLSFREAGFLMGASCGGRDTVSYDECEAKGLQYAHAYSILDVQQVEHYRLLKLRNPHGHGTRQSWNGDWSDGSSRWTNQLKQQLLPHGANQGIFWICLRDLMKYFSDIDVCRYRPNWFEERIQGELLPHIPNKMTVMAVEILDTCEVDICLYQPTNSRNVVQSFAADFSPVQSKIDPFIFHEAHKGWGHQTRKEFEDITVLVMRYQTAINDMMLDSIPLPVSCAVYSDSNIKPSVSLSAVLDPGFYAIIPLSFNILSEFCITTTKVAGAAATPTPTHTGIPYSLALFSSKPVVTDMGSTQIGFLSHSLFLLAEKSGNKTVAFKGMWVSEVYLKNSCRVIVAENHAGWSHFMVTMECNEGYNLVSSRGSLFTCDCIPPKHRQIIAVLTQLERGGYMFSARLEFESSMANPLGKWGASHTPEIHSGISQLHNPQPISSHR